MANKWIEDNRDKWNEYMRNYMKNRYVPKSKSKNKIIITHKTINMKSLFS